MESCGLQSDERSLCDLIVGLELDDPGHRGQGPLDLPGQRERATVGVERPRIVGHRGQHLFDAGDRLLAALQLAQQLGPARQ